MSVQNRVVVSALNLPRAKLWAVALLGILILLFVVPAPVFPQDTLDGGWILATEYAAHTGAVFGRDFVFTYGPLAVLATGLFASSSFIWVLLSSLAIGACWLGPLFAARRPYVLVLYALAVPALIFWFDARVVAAMLASCLLGMVRPNWWSVAAAAGWGAIALSKLSFALIALPLLFLVDLQAILVWRRMPMHIIAFLAAFLIGLSASGTGPALWLEAARNDGNIISAYSSSMQFVMHLGGAAAMLITLAVLAVAAIYFSWLAWAQRRPLHRPTTGAILPVLAIVWCLWMSFKMGFVRADSHMVITWAMLSMAVPAIVGVFEAQNELTLRQRMAAPALMLIALAGTFGFAAKTLADPAHGPTTVLKDHAAALLRRPVMTLSWLTPAGWRHAALTRQKAEADLRRSFAFPAGTTADVIPQRLGPVIFSTLAYHPRPVPQSYSSYTPMLQQLDARHFATADAPALLFMDVFSEIDERLPTLSVGPSLPIIARWYDVIGADPLGAVLRHRQTPKAVRQTISPRRSAPFGEWIDLPSASSTSLITAEIDVPRGLLARATGLLAREPVLSIELRRADRRIDRYRLVPGMAQMGVVVSPMVRNPTWLTTIPDRTIGLVAPGSRPEAVVPITAIRFAGDPLAPYAYANPTVRFRRLEFNPGITRHRSSS